MLSESIAIYQAWPMVRDRLLHEAERGDEYNLNVIDERDESYSGHGRSVRSRWSRRERITCDRFLTVTVKMETSFHSNLLKEINCSAKYTS